MEEKRLQEELLTLSGVDVKKCMKCGRCSASCPAYEEMDIKPNQFVSYAARGEITPLIESKSLWVCLSCLTCAERCPRNVAPGKLIEAARQMNVRRKGETHLSPNEVPKLLNDALPQQLLAAAFRKYRK